MLPCAPAGCILEGSQLYAPYLAVFFFQKPGHNSPRILVWKCPNCIGTQTHVISWPTVPGCALESILEAAGHHIQSHRHLQRHLRCLRRDPEVPGGKPACSQYVIGHRPSCKAKYICKLCPNAGFDFSHPLLCVLCCSQPARKRKYEEDLATKLTL